MIMDKWVVISSTVILILVLLQLGLERPGYLYGQLNHHLLNHSSLQLKLDDLKIKSLLNNLECIKYIKLIIIIK